MKILNRFHLSGRSFNTKYNSKTCITDVIKDADTLPIAAPKIPYEGINKKSIMRFTATKNKLLNKFK